MSKTTFRADDEPLLRAEKIWCALGFANDPLGQAAQMAAYLAVYRDWDRQRDSIDPTPQKE